MSPWRATSATSADRRVTTMLTRFDRARALIHIRLARAVAMAGLALASPRSGASQERNSNSAPALSLADAIAFARARHPALPAASARRQIAVALARQESAFPNPVIEWRRE